MTTWNFVPQSKRQSESEVKRYSRFLPMSPKFHDICLINSLLSNVYRLSLSPHGLSQLTSTIQNQIPYATESRLLIGFTHWHGFRAATGCPLQGPHRLHHSAACSGSFQWTETAACFTENQQGCAANLEWW